jgi:hypothetical protein
VLLKEGKVFLKDAPHELQVNAEVLMNQDITMTVTCSQATSEASFLVSPGSFPNGLADDL